MRKPTGNPNGRPHALTLEQEQRVYAVISATKRGKRSGAYSRLAFELRVSVPTLQRAYARQASLHLASIVDRLHVKHQNHPSIPVPGETV